LHNVSSLLLTTALSCNMYLFNPSFVYVFLQQLNSISVEKLACLKNRLYIHFITLDRANWV